MIDVYTAKNVCISNEISHFHIVSLTFHNFGNTVYPQLSNYWKGRFSTPFQTGNGWKSIIGNTYKATEMQ